MARARVLLFLIGVLIVLVGLSLLISVRVEIMRRAGEPIGGPEAWATLVNSIANFWSQMISGVEQEYRIGLTVLIIGVVVMVVPIALPEPRR